MSNLTHKAGFVNIIGKPNVGKSTLMNVLVGERLSIITSKAQTTRHRIFGILSGEDFQIVYSDTPGLIEKPQYELHKSMMGFINSSLEDADVILFVADLYDKEMEQEMIDRVAKAEVPVILIINKIDLAKSEEQIEEVTTYWQERLKPHATLKISALAGTHTEALLPMIMDLLPEHPAYFDKEELSDRNERFFASEIIREKIFTNYKKEVPYSTEVAVTSFKEEEDIIRIHAEIFVERKSQKGILIGEGGKALKKVGIEARQDLEKFFGKHVYLETHVRVEEGWRTNQLKLKRFGYQQ